MTNYKVYVCIETDGGSILEEEELWTPSMATAAEAYERIVKNLSEYATDDN